MKKLHPLIYNFDLEHKAFNEETYYFITYSYYDREVVFKIFSVDMQTETLAKAGVPDRI